MFRMHDRGFDSLLENEFLMDLRCAAALTARESLSVEQEQLLGMLKQKYADGCPSHLYARAAPRQQREYGRIHRALEELLYE